MKLNKKLKALVILPVFGAMMLQGCTDGSGGPAFATPTNQIPVITSATAATTPEGTVDAFYTATATDGDNHALTFSIAGFDAAQFEIDGTTGDVVFAAAPDFEAPTDADGDNVYAFTLTVTDSEGGSASHFISVTVTDVIDAGQRYVEEIFSTLDEQRDVEFAPGLFMDVFTPADDTVTDRPVMILASGGGFVNENRTRVEGLAVEFAQRGYVAATIDYRVGSGQLSADELTLAGMAATHDMFAAVRYFRADALDANTFGISADAIFVSGESAGAVMSAIAATLDPDDTIVSTALADYHAANGGVYGDIGDFTDVSSEVNGALAFTGAILDLDWVDENSKPLYAAHEEFDPILPCGTAAEGAHFSGLVVSGACTLVPAYEAAGALAEFYFVAAVVDHVGYSDEQEAEIIHGAAVFFLENVIWAQE